MPVVATALFVAWARGVHVAGVGNGVAVQGWSFVGLIGSNAQIWKVPASLLFRSQ